jgi:hypothetical protein
VRSFQSEVLMRRANEPCKSMGSTGPGTLSNKVNRRFFGNRWGVPGECLAAPVLRHRVVGLIHVLIVIFQISSRRFTLFNLQGRYSCGVQFRRMHSNHHSRNKASPYSSAHD